MTVQKMKATKTQTNRFLDGFQNIQASHLFRTAEFIADTISCPIAMQEKTEKGEKVEEVEEGEIEVVVVKKRRSSRYNNK